MRNRDSHKAREPRPLLDEREREELVKSLKRRALDGDAAAAAVLLFGERVGAPTPRPEILA